METDNSNPAASPNAYEIDGRFSTAEDFVREACDPRRSVVVEACAGSGKTWLLVARMLRLLLAGAAPSELLAITFTRKASQEMRERLMQLLHQLALAPDSQASLLLLERGVPQAELAGMLPIARGLYERVLSSSHALSIDTFHSWFGRLVQIAPLASGVPHGYALTETTGELMREAYSTFMQSLNDAENVEVKAALLELYETVGDSGTKKLLDAFVGKRAEWWAATQHDAAAPLLWLQDLCGEDGLRDARLILWDDTKTVGAMQSLAWLLGQGTAVNQKRATAIETALSAGAGVENFNALCHQFFSDDGEPRRNTQTKSLLAALESNLGADAFAAFETRFNAIGDTLKLLRRRSAEPAVIALNQALFIAGSAYLARFQAMKADQRVFDFSDLEWQAYRLLTNDEHSAYLHSRLDTRYKHILLDEFQDTNPLQWNIVLAWLAAYGGDVDRPSVFVVGDPKQSIYRFRRAEPRVFDAARDFLKAQGAAILRTNQTRRNATAIVETLNASFGGNPIFSEQTTTVGYGGDVWRLPLIRIKKNAQPEQTDLILRNPLLAPREEDEDVRRRDEGHALARALWHAKATLGVPWSDVMLLVKKRAHMSAYESALREVGIPFMSDKRGGLLESLEVMDLIALLTFLMTPGDNRALAHVLKSPIVGAGDDDLIALAQRSESSWRQRLQAAAENEASMSLQRAANLLTQWLAAAPSLPVHDLLDRILHQGQLIARYAQATPATMRGQVIANIEAFTELALNLDAGRYPSLPKFIDALLGLQNGETSDAPDEADIDTAVDAVRILTIHSAKGLEAPVVVLLDANHSKSAREDAGILCDWPQDAAAPTHFSAFGRKDERGAARDALFASEEKIKEQEDWNLLYVAVTRAKKLLIVSGIAAEKNADADGVSEGSWYERLQKVREIIADDLPQYRDEIFTASTQHDFVQAIFDPAAMPASVSSMEPTLVGNADAIEEGIALHVLLERLTHSRAWPIDLPDAHSIARWLSCPPALAEVIREQAGTMLAHPQLEHFYNPSLYRYARNEMEVIVDNEAVRFDRLVVFDHEVWVLDYKRNLLDSERAAYQAQLAGYRAAAQAVFAEVRVKTALITFDGRLWEFD